MLHGGLQLVKAGEAVLWQMLVGMGGSLCYVESMALGCWMREIHCDANGTDGELSDARLGVA